ncbi:CapA family protein, partial [Blautia pseudococcoides]|nr:CapA family protein [Blautia pseudococcoides]
IKDGELQEDNVKNIIPCRISSEDGYNNYQPTPAEGEQKDDILQKIEEYSSWVQG